MPCAEAESRLHAYFDGELDALDAAAFEGHLETCAHCRAALEDLEAMRAALRAELPYERVPAALAARITESLDREAPARAHHEQGTPDDSADDPLAALTALTTLAARGRGARRGRPASGWFAPSFGRGVLTGAGGGLGRAYAQLLAQRGARVGVNDLGSGAATRPTGERSSDLTLRRLVAHLGFQSFSQLGPCERAGQYGGHIVDPQRPTKESEFFSPRKGVEDC